MQLCDISIFRIETGKVVGNELKKLKDRTICSNFGAKLEIGGSETSLLNEMSSKISEGSRQSPESSGRSFPDNFNSRRFGRWIDSDLI
jgi:hypothetical protein